MEILTTKSRSIIFLLLACLPAPQWLNAEPLTIRLSHTVAENTPTGQFANKFRTLVDERLKGRVKVNVYPNSQLFGDNQVLEAILLGDVQMAVPSLSKFKRYSRKLQIFDLPFLFSNIDEVEVFQNSEHGQRLLKTMERKGLKGLGYLNNGMKQLSANKLFRLPEHVRGLKFRIQPSDVIAEQMLALGAIPIKKPFSEVFTLLQTRAIDGQENTWSNIYSKKIFEIQDYIAETNHGFVGYMVVTSVEFWDQLPNDVRLTLQQLIDEAVIYGRAVAVEKETTDRQAIHESGKTTIIGLSDDEREKWINVMRPVWKRFERIIGKEVIDYASAINVVPD